jgi:hypothetical protein
MASLLGPSRRDRCKRPLPYRSRARRGCGTLAGTVHHHLKALKLDRWTDWPAGKARSITILRVPTAEPTRAPTGPTGPAVMPGNGRLRPARVHVDLSEFAGTLAHPCLTSGLSRSFRKSTPASPGSRRLRAGVALAPSPTRRTRHRYMAAAHRYCAAGRPAAPPRGGAGRQRSGRSR